MKKETQKKIDDIVKKDIDNHKKADLLNVIAMEDQNVFIKTSFCGKCNSLVIDIWEKNCTITLR